MDNHYNQQPAMQPDLQPGEPPVQHRDPGRRTVHPPALSIDCGDCVMAHTAACEDCIVSFVVNRDPGDAVVIDVEEHRALRLLQSAGLVPDSRHRSRVG